MKRFLAFLLAMVLLVSALPLTAVTAYAEETEGPVQEILPEETIPEALVREEEVVSQEEPALQQEELPEEKPLELTTVTAAPDVELPSGAELLDGYVQKQFYGGMSFFGDAAGARLTGDEKILYDAVKPFIKKLASGERTSAVIAVGKTVDIGEDHYAVDADANFTGSDFGQESLDRVVNALLSDMPFELYWYDKTAGCVLEQIVGENLIWVRANFYVADNYGDPAGFTVNADKAAAAVSAADKAKAIITKYAGKSDVQKLIGYKDEICALVSYDDAAAGSGSYSTDNDPWQLVHVFDGNTSTNVVCEGYSKAFMYLCDMTDFSGDVACNLATGGMNGGAHMWNIVTIEGSNYLVDVTNSESGTIGQDGSLFLAGTAGSIAEGYTFGMVTFTYDAETKATWGTGSSSILKLAEENYSLIPTKGEGWQIDDNGTLTVTGNMGNYAYNAYAPWYEARDLIKKVVIGGDVTFIGHYAFYDCNNLTEVQLHDGITSVGGYGFCSCGALQSIRLPASVTSIGDHAFAYCSKLESVNIPEGVQKIQGYTFNSCAALTQINIPNSVTEIGEFSFQDSGLTALTLPENLTTIGQSAFRNTKITTLTVPDSVTTVGYDAFWCCYSLTSVKIGKGVTRVRSGAFGNCTSLSSVTFTGDAPTIDSNAFKSVNATVYYPHDTDGWAGKLTNYGGTLNWRMGSSAETLSQGICGSSTVSWSVTADGVLFLSGAGAMPDYSYSSGKTTAPWSGYYLTIKKVVVEKGITYIGNHAFYGCENLKEIYFAGDYPTFGTNAMKGVSAKAQYLPSNTTWDPDVLTGFGGSISWKPKGVNDDYIAFSEASNGTDFWHIDYNGELWISSDYQFADLNMYGGAPWHPYRQHIKTLKIENGVYRIGNLSFYELTKLQKADLGNVTQIGNYAFEYCSALTDVEMGSDVNAIGKCAFYGCTALEEVFIHPTSNLTVSDYAFGNCTNLLRITIPGTVTLGKEIFEYCSKLNTIYIGTNDSLYAFNADANAFKYVTARVYYPTGSCSTTNKRTNYGGTLTWEEAKNGYCGSGVNWNYNSTTKTLTIRGNGKVSYAYGSGRRTPWGNFVDEIETVTVMNGVTGIGPYSFEFCENLTSISLPNSLKDLNASAFNDCGSLNNLLLPNGLESFSRYEFNRCESLTDIYYLGTQESWDKITNSDKVVSYQSVETIHKLQEVPTTATCTQSGKQAYYAFDDTSVYDGKYDAKGKPLTNLQTVPALGHDNDENGICKRCGNLEGLTYTIADGEVTITGYTGTRTELVLPAQIEGNPVTEIKVRAFQNNGILTAVTIPEGVKELGHYAFADCQNLKRVSIPGSVATISGWAFQNCYALEDVQLQEGLTAIGTYAFSHCTALETITLPTSFTYIDSKTFSDCTALKCVDGGTGLQYIGGSAFHLCENLESIEIGDNLTTIGPLAFGCCYKLKQIKIPASVTTIGSSAFDGCRGLESVAIPNGITAVDELTFAGCSSLKKITIPTSVETIGQSAFADCTALEEISLPHSVLYIENSAFKNCTALTSVAIPVGTISIGDESFSGCTALKTASFNPRCNTIGASAFSGCSALTTVHLGTYMNTIGDNAFAGCDKLKTVFWWYLKGAVIAQLTIGENNTCLTDAQWHNGVEGVTFAGKNCYYCRECESYLLEDGSHVLATITFQNEDGTVIESKEYKYKDPVTAPVPTREHAEPKAYRYVFIGWDKDVVACEGNAVYTASYREERIAYTVKFLNEDGTVISQNTYYYGEPVELPAEPTKEKDGYNTYTFAGWGKTVGNCTGDAEYTATFTATHYHTYTKKVTAPTYTKQGYTQYTCACGSSYKNAYTKAKGLLTPSVKVANDAATGKPKVSWAAIKEVSRYDVYRATSQTGTYTKLGSTTKTAFVDTTATLGKTYYYKVKAICTSDSSLSSGYSGIVSISTKVGQPKVTLSKNTKGYPVLKWSKVEGAKKYEVYVATSENGTYKKLTTTSKLTYTYTKAAAGKEYFFKVRAYGSSTSTAGAYCEPLRAVKVLATPKLTVTTKQATGQNTLKWKKITGATSYVLQCSVGGGSYKTIATTSKLTYTHTGLSGGNTYTYRLMAKSGVADAASSYSATKTTVIKCAAPSVSVTLNSKQKPTVTWQKVSGAVKYQVYYATAKSGKYKLVATVTGTSYTHSAAPTAKACYYKVVAVDKNGNLGSYSTVKNITTKCLAPTGVKVTANAKGKPVVSWSKTEGAKKYEIYVATSLNGTYKKLTTTSKLTYTYTKAKVNTTYYFKITAYGASTSSRSAYSPTVKF